MKDEVQRIHRAAALVTTGRGEKKHGSSPLLLPFIGLVSLPSDFLSCILSYQTSY
jgi:hypothetical protein